VVLSQQTGSSIHFVSVHFTECSHAEFGSGHKYRKHKFPSQKFHSVHLPTHIYYSETRRFQQHDDNSNFTTLIFAMAAAADEMFHLTVILRQKMVRNIAKVC